MKILLDEQLSETAAEALNVVIRAGGHQVLHINELGASGMSDEDIPSLRAQHDIQALVTVNVKDFGARLYYFTALVEAGIHVAVIRPGKLKMDVGGQLGLLASKASAMVSSWEKAESPILLRVTQGGVSERSLQDLLKEIDGTT